MTKLLRESDWQRVRLYFTDEEKALLNAAISGETICPKGCIIDMEKAGETGQKLLNLLEALKIMPPQQGNR